MLPTLYRPKRLSNIFDSWFEDDNFYSFPTTVAKTSSRWAYKENDNEYILETSLPEGITSEGVKAEIRDGVLKVVVAKPEAKVIEITEVTE